MAMGTFTRVIGCSNTTIIAWLLSLAIALTSYPVLSQKLDKAKAQDQLNDFIENLLDSKDIHGLSLSVVHKNNVWFTNGFGYADAEVDIKATQNTQFRVGSVTSLFTAMLILKLEEEGKLHLSDKISRYLPGLPFTSHDGKQYDMTIKQLLTHHSGLPLSVLKGSWAESPSRFTELFNANNTIYFSQAPDTIYTYSNIGYALLGMLVEKLTGQSFEQAMENLLLNPLAMNHSGFAKPGHELKSMAKGYKKGEERTLLYPRDLPSLGLYSSAQDLSNFMRYILNFNKSEEDVLSQAQIEKMLRIQNIHVEADLGKKVGLGWTVGGMAIKNAGLLLWRGGASLFHRSRVVLLPKMELGVAVLANDSRAWEVIEKIAEKALTLALEVEYGIQQPEKSEEEKAVEPYGLEDDFAAYYSSFLGYIPIKKDKDEVRAELVGWKILAKPDGKGWYDLQYDLFGFIPIDISWIANVKVRPARISGHRVLIVLYKGTQHLFASYTHLNSVHTEWKKHLGEYKLRNPDKLTEVMEVKKGKLLIENNKLFFTYELPIFLSPELKVPVKTMSNNEAIIPGLGTALNEMVFVRKDKGDVFLEFSGYQIEKVKE